MCGIAGVVTFNSGADIFLSKLEKSISVLEKRGPDHKGTFIHEKVALGHTRLSVIDVSEQAFQPFTDQSGRYTIVYNGEIYNYRELREYLIRNGFKFRSQSDTEVLLNLYIHEGAACLNKLNGFFAFAIYDNIEKSLLIARDRMGKKPLLIYQDENKFIFASEMKALLSFDIPKELDYISLFQYLQLNYIPSPDSILKGVKKLKSGHYIFIKDKLVQEKKYYEIPYDKHHLISSTTHDC